VAAVDAGRLTPSDFETTGVLIEADAGTEQVTAHLH